MIAQRGDYFIFEHVYVGPRQLPKLAYYAASAQPCALCGLTIPKAELFTLGGRAHPGYRPRCAVCVPFELEATRSAEVRTMPNMTPFQRTEQANARRAAILRFIGGWIECYGYSPTIAEIGAGVEIRSKGLIAYHLSILERDGWITRGAPGQRKNAPRTIRLAGLGELGTAPRKRGYYA